VSVATRLEGETISNDTPDAAKRRELGGGNESLTALSEGWDEV
jgi:hypothetical protein